MPIEITFSPKFIMLMLLQHTYIEAKESQGNQFFVVGIIVDEVFT